MYRGGIELQSEDRVSFVLNHGALGDVICSLPAIVQARRTHHERMKMFVWTPPWQMDLLRHLLAPYGAFEIRDMKEFPLKAVQRGEGWEGGPVAFNQIPWNVHTRNRVHMVDYAFGCLLDARPESMLERSYPNLAPLGERKIPQKYVVFPVGATSENKLFKAKVMVPVIAWAIEHGYLPVIVGTKTSYVHAEYNGKIMPIAMIDEADKIPADTLAACMDLREKTTLLELRDVLGHAAAVVGVDGGTLHLAGTTDTNIVYAMATTLPKHRYIARGGDPSHKIRYVGPRDLECTGCQSNMTLLFHHDFRFCPYKDSKCMDMLHPDDFTNALLELGL